MNMNSVLDKLSLQIDSFQEGFEVLSQAKDLKDMAKNFRQILGGNFLVSDVNIFHRKNTKSDWKDLNIKNESSGEFLSGLEVDNQFTINFLKNPDYKIFILLPLSNSSSFAILIGQKLDKSDFNALDKVSLQIFVQLLSNAYHAFLNLQKEKKLIFSLNQRVLQLNDLIDAGIELSKIDQNVSLITYALERIVALTNASKGAVQIKSGRKIKETICFPVKLKMADCKNNVNLISDEFKFLTEKYTFAVVDKESRKGIIPFDRTDKLLLESLVKQVQVALENRYLFEESLEKQRIEQDISVAGTIQKTILPETLPEVEGYDLAGINIPSKDVGGDFYDCFQLRDGKTAFVIADVSGKGVPAALLVNSLHASLHAYLESNLTLSELVQKLNLVIFNSSTIDKYLTFFIAILNPTDGKLEYVNAGHNPIFLRRKNGKLKKLLTGGTVLGMMGFEIPFESETLSLNKGETLLLYTDGIPEATSNNKDFYEDETLENYFLNNSKISASEFIDNLLADIKKFTGNVPQSDDITALYLKRLK